MMLGTFLIGTWLVRSGRIQRAAEHLGAPEVVDPRIAGMHDVALPVGADQDGRQRQLTDFKGRVVVLFFGYTQCPDVCPTTLAELQAFNNYLSSTVHVAHAHRVRGERWADDPAAIEAMKRKVPQSMGDCMALIENGMLRGPWVMGERYSVADMYLFTIAGWLEGDGVDTSKLPRVLEHRARMLEDPVVQRVCALYA